MTNSPTAGMKTSRQPATMPGIASGKVTFQKALIGGQPRSSRGLDQRVVHLVEGGEDRQRHERQVGIDDADIDRRVRVEDRQRMVDDVQPQQELVEQPLRLEDADPGIDADQEARPERQDDHHEQRRADARRRARHAVGERKADQERQEGRDRRDLEAGDVGEEVEVVLRQPDVVVEAELAGLLPEMRKPLRQIEGRRVGRHRQRRLREGQLQHDDEGHQEEYAEPEIGQDDDEAADEA